jgi:DNA-binding response OmpR family regulator
MGDSARKLRILILEHCNECSAALPHLTKMLGHEVRTGRNGAEAIEVGTEFRPDVVILHIRMFGQDGYEVARRIRDQSWGTGVILIALTGAGEVIDERRFRGAGFDHHLTKPIDVGALVGLIGRPLSHSG